MVQETAKNGQDTEGQHCPVCEAPLRRGDTRCWLCGAIEARRELLGEQCTISDLSQPGSPVPGVEEGPAAADNDASLGTPSAKLVTSRGKLIEQVGGFSLSSLMMFVTLACVLLGTITIAPGVGVPLAFVAFFTWLRTVNVVRRRATMGVAVSASDKFLLFVGSFLSTAALLPLIGAAAAAALITAIYTTCAIDSPESPDDYVLAAFIAGLVTIAAIFVVFLLIRYKLRLWRRDFGEPNDL
jgi:hypothetical protein